MKTALVLEGGAMRGMYTAGVLDVFMEQGITFDGVIGVSAGALFGVNLLSGQKGRAVRYNKKFNSDPDYMGVKSLLTTGNIVNTEFAYKRVPEELDPFDGEAYKKSGIPFYAVISNIRTGKAEYVLVEDVFEQMDVLRASGSMPFVSKPVKIDGEQYLDGAVIDSIPFEKMLELGYDQLVVVLTKCDGYIKKPIPKLLADGFYKRKYPKFAQAVANRHIMYNGQMIRLKTLEQEGKVVVLRPTRQVDIGKIEKNPEKIQEMYDLGVEDAKRALEELRLFQNI